MSPATPPAANPDAAKEQVISHGWETTSFQTLGGGLIHWEQKELNAQVAYVATGGSWVAAGGPVCPRAHQGAALEAFSRTAQNAGRRAVFFCTEQPTISAIDALSDRSQKSFSWVKIGEQPVFDPRTWSLAGRARRNIRAQVNRARNHGLEVQEVPWQMVEKGGRWRHQAEELIQAWMGARHMSPMGFLVDLHPFEHKEARRYFLAIRGGELVGMLAAVPVYRRHGWFVEDLIRHPNAPNGTPESLVHQALTQFGAEDVPFMTLGLAPLARVTEGEYIRSARGIRPWLPRLFSLAHGHLGFLYNFDGLYRFKAKFKPDSWEPIFMVIAPSGLRLTVVWDLLSAFVPTTRVQFALDTGRRVLHAVSLQMPIRGWVSMAWAFSLLLIPWMALLLAVDPMRHFGTTWLPHAWVSFDVAMCVGFASLASIIPRWPHLAASVSRIMLGAVGADLWLTTSQVIFFNLPESETATDVGVAILAILAPASAALFLLLLSARLGRES